MVYAEENREDNCSMPIGILFATSEAYFLLYTCCILAAVKVVQGF